MKNLSVLASVPTCFFYLLDFSLIGFVSNLHLKKKRKKFERGIPTLMEKCGECRRTPSPEVIIMYSNGIIKKCGNPDLVKHVGNNSLKHNLK